MPPQRARSPARLLAPVALVVLALAVLLIVLSSSGGGEEAPKRAGTTDDSPATTTSPSAAKRPRARSNYTVKRGDTLGSISENTGIEVERLQELNPQLDPQALVAGQKIKLRE